MVMKEINKYGSLGAGSQRAAWFTTLAGNSNRGGEFPVPDGGSEVENAKGAEERRVQRRQRSGGGGAEVVPSPDLLTVPGVGPKNLRKLVEKGFEGVAQLKQLYKDKVFLLCSTAFFKPRYVLVNIRSLCNCSGFLGFFFFRFGQPV